MFIRRSTLAFVALVPLTLHAAAPSAGPSRIPVDLVICLDTSGSMTQLIDSARGRIWDIVTELGTATPTPTLRVGLLTYGTPDTSSAEQGWIVRQSDLTDDLDTIYGKMMALTTRGGDEFVGWVLDDALKTMNWSDDEGALRLIFVAGNESADQGADQRNFRYVAEAARARDIIINPIYAGSREQGVGELWDQVAVHGGGDFAAIDMEAGTVQVASPFDIELTALNHELNATYIPYGEKGASGLANQLAQDANAGRMGAQSCGSRVAAKGCVLYNNALWDLVDAAQQPTFDWTTLDSHDLPEQLRTMTLPQRKNYVAGMHAVRQAVRERITAVGAERKAWLQAETRKLAGGQSLDDAMLGSLRRQAETRGFKFSTMTQVSTAPAEARMTVPQIAPEKPISAGARTQLTAFEAALPAVAYRVGAYETRQHEFAQILAAKTAAPMRFAAGDRVFTSEESARDHLLYVLDSVYEDLRRVQIVQPETMPGVVPGGPVGMSYRVGGIVFGNIKDAEYAHEQIMVATRSFEDERQKWSAWHGGWNEQSVNVTSGCRATIKKFVDQYVSQYHETMLVIAHTAAQAFTDRGC